MKWKRLFPVLLCLVLLAGCAEARSPEQGIEKLQASGFSVTWHCESKVSLRAAASSFNQQIQDMGGGFTVEITGYIALRKGSREEYTSCQFIWFGTTGQAADYYALMLDTRAEGEAWLYLQDNLVVFTNSKEAVNLLGFNFM